MFYVTDTHPLVWYIVNKKLKHDVDKIFSGAEKGEWTVFIPTIALAEIRYLAEHKKIELDFPELLRKIEASSDFVPVPLDFQTIKFMPENLEIHDQIVVATARVLNAKLVTRDRKIRKLGIVECVLC